MHDVSFLFMIYFVLKGFLLAHKFLQLLHVSETTLQNPLFIFFQLFDQLIHICRKPRHQDSLCCGCKYCHCNILCIFTGTGSKNINSAYKDSCTPQYQRNIFVLHSLSLLQCDPHKIQSDCCDQQFRFNIIHKRFHEYSQYLPCRFDLFYEFLQEIFHKFPKNVSYV